MARQARRPVAPLLTARLYSLTMLVVSPVKQRQAAVVQPDAGPSPTQTWLLLSIRSPLGPPQALRTAHVAGLVPTKPPLPMPPRNVSFDASNRSTALFWRSARMYLLMSFLTKLMSKLFVAGGGPIVRSNVTVGSAAFARPAVSMSTVVRTVPETATRAGNFSIVLPLRIACTPACPRPIPIRQREGSRYLYLRYAGVTERLHHVFIGVLPNQRVRAHLNRHSPD